MNVLAAALLVYVALGVELALKPTLALGGSGIAPSLVLPVVVFIAMYAAAAPTLWLALIAGLVIDLSAPRALQGGGDIWLVGPNALGFTLGAYAALQLRALFIRGNPVSVAILSGLAATLAGITAATVLSVRGIAERTFGYTAQMSLAPRDELLAGLGSAVYTAVVAVAVAMLMRRLMPVLGLHDPHARRYGR